MSTGNGTTRKVQILELPRDQIDAAVKAARAGQSPATAQGPPAKATTWIGVRQLPPADGIVPWNVELDALPVKKLVTQPIPLKCKGSDITQLLFAGLASQAAVLTRVAPTDPLRPHQIHADRYDLATGQGLGSRGDRSPGRRLDKRLCIVLHKQSDALPRRVAGHACLPGGTRARLREGGDDLSSASATELARHLRRHEHGATARQRGEHAQRDGGGSELQGWGKLLRRPVRQFLRRQLVPHVQHQLYCPGDHGAIEGE